MSWRSCCSCSNACCRNWRTVTLESRSDGTGRQNYCRRWRLRPLQALSYCTIDTLFNSTLNCGLQSKILCRSSTTNQSVDSQHIIRPGFKPYLITIACLSSSPLVSPSISKFVPGNPETRLKRTPWRERVAAPPRFHPSLNLGLGLRLRLPRYHPHT